MRLETEFRVRLQLMQLEQNFCHVAVPHPCDLNQQELASVWVKLVQPPNDLCGDEALLLCRSCGDRWLAWVPDYGEIVLEAAEFFNDVD